MLRLYDLTMLDSVNSLQQLIMSRQLTLFKNMYIVFLTCQSRLSQGQVYLNHGYVREHVLCWDDLRIHLIETSLYIAIFPMELNI